MKAYLVDVGILVDTDYDNGAYSSVYDKQHGYYDEDQYYCADKEQAIKEVLSYVEQGVEKTYGVVSETFLNVEATDLSEIPVSQETYNLNDIVFSAKKEGNEIIKDFIHYQRSYESPENAKNTDSDWLENLDEIDRDCVEQYEFLLGRPLKDHNEYSTIDKEVDEMILEWETPEEFFKAYPNLKKYAANNNNSLADKINLANNRVQSTNSSVKPELNIKEPKAER